ncbi:hypothetical protein D3C83_318050 [compost metagenome]
MMIPAEEQQVSLVGETLTVERADGNATYNSAGRPVAVVSSVMVEYVEPLPARRPPARK